MAGVVDVCLIPEIPFQLDMLIDYVKQVRAPFYRAGMEWGVCACVQHVPGMQGLMASCKPHSSLNAGRICSGVVHVLGIAPITFACCAGRSGAWQLEATPGDAHNCTAQQEPHWVRSQCPPFFSAGRSCTALLDRHLTPTTEQAVPEARPCLLPCWQSLHCSARTTHRC